MISTDIETYFRTRLTELRLQKGVSAREMSLALGQNVSYINRIENGLYFPSMQVFFYICEYLEISPKDFFNRSQKNPKLLSEITNAVESLSTDQQQALLTLLSR